VNALSLSRLNELGRGAFVEAIGPCFEASPWVAERAWAARPFHSLGALHATLVGAMRGASEGEKLALIRAHPDLVGALARGARPAPASLDEQRAAGLDRLSSEETALLESYNSAYKEKFGFPFVICARENRKEAILSALPSRLGLSREEELETALREIAAIARLRLLDRVEED
jgi:2-oxo-4-hydroxy-4-carboxy-5-ureidoimidazoline decarboxylase